MFAVPFGTKENFRFDSRLVIARREQTFVGSELALSGGMYENKECEKHPLFAHSEAIYSKM